MQCCLMSSSPVPAYAGAYHPTCWKQNEDFNMTPSHHKDADILPPNNLANARHADQCLGSFVRNHLMQEQTDDNANIRMMCPDENMCCKDMLAN